MVGFALLYTTAEKQFAEVLFFRVLLFASSSTLGRNAIQRKKIDAPVESHQFFHINNKEKYIWKSINQST